MMPEEHILVIGGTGGVGEGIVEALLAEPGGRSVLVASRDATKLEALRARRGEDARLVTLRGSVDNLQAARSLLTAARSHGTLGAVVASLGGWWEGAPLTGLDEASWFDALGELLTPHFMAARTFVPALAEEPVRGASRYLLIGGGAALTPVPRSSLVSIAGAAQLMLARALVAERPGLAQPIVETLVVDGPVKTNARHHGPETEREITAREVGDVVAALLRDGTTGTWPAVARDGMRIVMRPRPRS